MNNRIYPNVIHIAEEGIILESEKKKIYINFEDCAKEFSLEKGDKLSRCVATRDVTTLSFTFFTRPKTTVVFKKNVLKKIFTGRTTTRNFFDLQNAIIEAGYTSYDLS